MPSPPGEVTIPAGLAQQLARLAIVGAREMHQRDGSLVLPVGMATLLAELATSASGPAPATIGTGMVITCTEAAGRLGVTSRHVRRLAAGGQLIARKHGREWAIDPDSIRRAVA